MRKYMCGAGTPEEAETNCISFYNGECHCHSCQYCVQETRYKEIKDWLIENYATRDDVDIVYSALCELLNVLDEEVRRK